MEPEQCGNFVEIEVLAEKASIEYGGCGTHLVKIRVLIERGNLATLYDKLNEILN